MTVKLIQPERRDIEDEFVLTMARFLRLVDERKIVAFALVTLDHNGECQDHFATDGRLSDWALQGALSYLMASMNDDVEAEELP